MNTRARDSRATSTHCLRLVSVRMHWSRVGAKLDVMVMMTPACAPSSGKSTGLQGQTEFGRGDRQPQCKRPVTTVFRGGFGSDRGRALDAEDVVHERGLMDTVAMDGVAGQDSRGETARAHRRKSYTLEEKQRLVAEKL